MIDHNPKIEKWKLAAGIALIVISLFFFAAIADVGAGENGGGCCTWHDGDKDYYPQVRSLVLASDSDNSPSSDITEAKSCLAGAWIRKDDTPKQGGVGEAVVGTGDYIYAARCYTTGSCDYWQYNPGTNTWTSKSVPDQRFKNGLALAWNGKNYIYVLLGAAYGDADRRFFYRYNISSDVWGMLNTTPHPQGAGDALTWSGYDNQIYALLGSNGHSTAFACYNASNGSWCNLTFNPNWTCTDDGAALVWAGGEYLYALQGEWQETVPCSNFARYNISSDTWVDLADIPEGECGVGDGGSLLWIGNWKEECANYIYSLGGGCAENENVGGYNFYSYVISNNTWLNLPSILCPVGKWVGNRLGFANSHLYYWQGAPATWDCGGDAFFMFEINTPPEITYYAPESPVNDYAGANRTFEITITQTVNVSWQINGTEVQTNASVTETSYTNTSAVNGIWNVAAIVSNANGTGMQTWTWTVTSPCFIATAAYGTPLHEDIDVLRDFRDKYLMSNPAGRAFVKSYYSFSPPLADLIMDNAGLRTAVRNAFVEPLVDITRRLVE